MGLTLGDEQIYYNSQPSFKPPLPGLCSMGRGVVLAAVVGGGRRGFSQLGMKSNIYDRALAC